MNNKMSLSVVGVAIVAALVGFLLGSSIQPLRSQPAAQAQVTPPSSDALVERLVGEVDETGRQARADITALTELMKRIVRQVEVGQQYPELEQQGKLLAERVGLDAEIAFIQTLLAVLEKSVVRQGQEVLVMQRISEFFNVPQSEVHRYREAGYTLSSLVLGYGIAKAAKAPANNVFQMRQMRQSFPAIAASLGVKQGGLGEALKGLFP